MLNIESRYSRSRFVSVQKHSYKLFLETYQPQQECFQNVQTKLVVCLSVPSLLICVRNKVIIIIILIIGIEFDYTERQSTVLFYSNGG